MSTGSDSVLINARAIAINRVPLSLDTRNTCPFLCRVQNFLRPFHTFVPRQPYDCRRYVLIKAVADGYAAISGPGRSTEMNGRLILEVLKIAEVRKTGIVARTYPIIFSLGLVINRALRLIDGCL